MDINILITFFGLSVKFFQNNAQQNIKKKLSITIIHKMQEKLSLTQALSYLLQLFLKFT